MGSEMCIRDRGNSENFVAVRRRRGVLFGCLFRPIAEEAAIRSLGGTSAEFFAGLRSVFLAQALDLLEVLRMGHEEVHGFRLLRGAAGRQRSDHQQRQESDHGFGPFTHVFRNQW